MIVYDIEIKKAIKGKNQEIIEGVDYCDGWHDKKNMGVSCICVYDYDTNRYRVFMEDNLDEFQKLVDSTDLIIGFNSIAFDNEVVSHSGINVPTSKSYDILVEIWKGAGLSDKFEYPSHTGFSLDACSKANFDTEKTGWGGYAPVWYQRGEHGKLIDYCINDVVLTVDLLNKIIRFNVVDDPREGFDSTIPVKPPKK